MGSRVMGQRFFAVYSKGARRRRILPRRGADMHASAAVVTTATVSVAVRSSALLFTVAFHVSRCACDVPMILRGRFEVSSATAGSAAPHTHICCRRGNGDAFDCRALCGLCSSRRLFFQSHVYRSACSMPMVLRGLLEVS